MDHRNFVGFGETEGCRAGREISREGTRGQQCRRASPDAGRSAAELAGFRGGEHGAGRGEQAFAKGAGAGGEGALVGFIV